ncbi:LysR substrate-binding domain-containing protein [Pseudomonas sp. RIT-PI-S]|uniref:LysR substrate-binding domain-containing protein n=1 Tax=Pseudomonas sp. RIT-PI-S TaxID=3035295 RepID=UPI0021DA8A49|nr:LysR substrate-binding domain-containing protein [Pseudomonas sp. RIT-PI-S]
MNRNDLRRADINLLIVFETLMHERNVTRTAEKLFLGQPAISAALNRLRALFDDPLFIRTGRYMEPTARAEEILVQLSPALDAMSSALSCSSGFDPGTSQATFRIGLSDDVEYGLLPACMRQLRRVAPDITLVVRRVDYWQMPHLLASGEISVGVSYTRDLPANAKRKFLRYQRPTLLRSEDHGPPLTLDQYCERPHALVSYAGDLSGFIDTELEKLGRSRRVKLAVPQFSSLPILLAGCELIATVPGYVAEAMVANGGVRAEPLPFEAPQFEVSMAWRGALDTDPAERWLRNQLAQMMREVTPTGEAVSAPVPQLS